jgi:DNA-directed RNA polymerase subunit RPC12/RpoP
MKRQEHLTGIACQRCGRELVSLGTTDFRTGGTSGVAHLFLGSWAELGESTLELELLACDSCGHVELQLPKKDR